MTHKLLDLIVFIGRFECPHIGHIDTIRQGLMHAKRVLILLGSADEPRSPRNPWTYDERIHMIMSSLNSEEENRICYSPLYNCTYNDPAWEVQVQSLVEEFSPDGGTVGIIGPKKDPYTTMYINWFPQYKYVETIGSDKTMNATDIRNSIFNDHHIPHDLLPIGTYDYLMHNYMGSPDYINMCGEYDFLAEHAKMWAFAPHPPSFNTVDAVVIQSGHILLIRRRTEPGKGLWALPGGYLNPGETQLEAMIRELKEESKIKVPEKVLRGSIVQNRTFDDPYRSSRGRIITQAYHVLLNNVNAGLPPVKGADDADKAQWYTLNEFLGMRSVMFEDHFYIVKSLLGI